jgi:hypothetical protein
MDTTLIRLVSGTKVYVHAVIDHYSRRILAQVDVVFSNSMIESWWKILKHWWLYLNVLATIDDVRKQTAFYVDQHNRVILFCLSGSQCSFAAA